MAKPSAKTARGPERRSEVHGAASKATALTEKPTVGKGAFREENAGPLHAYSGLRYCVTDKEGLTAA